MVLDKLNPLGIISLLLFIAGVILSSYSIFNKISSLIVIGGILVACGLIGSLANPYLKKNL